MKSEEVVLRSVPYIMQSHEGLVIFSQRSGFDGVRERLEFKKKSACWYLHVESNMPSGDIMVSHILAAHKICEERFGKDHEAAGRGEGRDEQRSRR